MAKRPLGLGKQNHQKKRKHDGTPNSTAEVDPVNQIQVELDDNVDPDDDIVQLRSLFKNYLKGEREDALILNAVVHECDRLLRNQEEEKVILNDEFHSIYALALSELTIFKAGEEEVDDKNRMTAVCEFFDAALERVHLGMSLFPDSDLLRLTKAKIIFQRIPLQYISQLTLESNQKDVADLEELLKEGKNSFRLVDDRELAVSESLDIFSDLLDIVENFGREDEINEGLDSDDEDLEDVELDTSHPLYQIRRNLDRHSEWLRQQLTSFFNTLPKPTSKDIEENSGTFQFFRKIANKTAQAYLDAAVKPSSFFTTHFYELEDVSEENKALAIQAQKEAQKLTEIAVKYFKEAESPDDPQSWVDTGEVLISLGNLQENESEQQAFLYGQAEDKISRANKASNGKFKHILDVLLEAEA